MTLLAFVLATQVLSQAEQPAQAEDRSSYPRIVRMSDGRTCIQSLDEKGAVVETCRSAADNWAAPAREADAVPKTGGLKRTAKLLPTRSASGLLAPAVAAELSAAMTKKSFSAVAIWTGAGFVAAALVVLAGAATAPEPARGSPAYAQGALAYAGIGAACIGVGVALSISADGNIERITAAH